MNSTLGPNLSSQEDRRERNGDRQEESVLERNGVDLIAEQKL